MNLLAALPSGGIALFLAALPSDDTASGGIAFWRRCLLTALPSGGIAD
jgi:hypothetical protein